MSAQCININVSDIQCEEAFPPHIEYRRCGNTANYSANSRSWKVVKRMRKRLFRLFSSAHKRTTPTSVVSITSIATVLQNLFLRCSTELLPSYTATKLRLHSFELCISYSRKRKKICGERIGRYLITNKNHHHLFKNNYFAISSK